MCLSFVQCLFSKHLMPIPFFEFRFSMLPGNRSLSKLCPLCRRRCKGTHLPLPGLPSLQQFNLAQRMQWYSFQYIHSIMTTSKFTTISWNLDSQTLSLHHSRDPFNERATHSTHVWLIAAKHIQEIMRLLCEFNF